MTTLKCIAFKEDGADQDQTNRRTLQGFSNTLQSVVLQGQLYMKPQIRLNRSEVR